MQSINPVTKQLTLLNYLMLNETESYINQNLARYQKSQRKFYSGQFEVVTRVDRPDGQHGRVVVLQRKISNVISEEVNINLDQFIGVCFVVENSSHALAFICVYLPPRTSDYRVIPERLELFIQNCQLRSNQIYSNVTSS